MSVPLAPPVAPTRPQPETLAFESVRLLPGLGGRAEVRLKNSLGATVTTTVSRDSLQSWDDLRRAVRNESSLKYELAGPPPGCASVEPFSLLEGVPPVYPQPKPVVTKLNWSRGEAMLSPTLAATFAASGDPPSTADKTVMTFVSITANTPGDSNIGRATVTLASPLGGKADLVVPAESLGTWQSLRQSVVRISNGKLDFDPPLFPTTPLGCLPTVPIDGCATGSGGPLSQDRGMVRSRPTDPPRQTWFPDGSQRGG